MTPSTLVNGWKCLLHDLDSIHDFDGFGPNDFLKVIHGSGNTDVTKDDIVSWLEMDQDETGYLHLTEDEIVASVLDKEEAEEKEMEEEPETEENLKTSHIRRCADDILFWINRVPEQHFQKFYEGFREFRACVISKQQASIKQGKIHDFFKPMPHRASLMVDDGVRASTSTSDQSLHIDTTDTE